MDLPKLSELPNVDKHSIDSASARLASKYMVSIEYEKTEQIRGPFGEQEIRAMPPKVFPFTVDCQISRVCTQYPPFHYPLENQNIEPKVIEVLFR